MKYYLVCCMVLALSLNSCTDVFFTESFTFDEGWKKDQTLKYNFEISEPKKDYNIYFIVRNNNDYPYRNLILFTELDGKKDTVYYNIADKEGRWLGTGLGDQKELTLQFKQNYHFQSAGAKSLKVLQAMRNDTLYGITDFIVLINKRN